MRINHAKIVTFSGIDGAGKSTQIEALQSYLEEKGFRSVLYSFWDDVVAFARIREFLSHKAFKGDKGVGSPDRPIQRRDKNVSSWYTIAIRLFFYLLDALSLRLTLARVPAGADVIVFDRYIYDELANLPLSRPFIRLYVRLLLAISPKPMIAYLVDADPDAAYLRKPEYPLEFLRQNRDSYIRLSHLIPSMRIVAPGSVDEISSVVRRLFSAAISGRLAAPTALRLQYPSGGEDT